MDANPHSHRDENSLLILLIAAGILLIALEPHLKHWLPHSLVTTLGGLGEAFFIAGALGFIVDRGLKQTLAKDALSFLVGWEVTPALREAVKEIIRIPCVRHDFSVHYTIERCENLKGFIRLQSETRFCVENMTAKPLPYTFQSRVESTAFSEITTAALQNRTLEMGIANSPSAKFTDVMSAPDDQNGVMVRTHQLTLAGHGKRWFRTVREQYFPEQFFVVLDLLAPACEGVTINLTPTKEFNVKVRFGAAPDSDPEVSGTSGEKCWNHDGVLLPGQHVRIRWEPA